MPATTDNRTPCSRQSRQGQAGRAQLLDAPAYGAEMRSSETEGRRRPTDSSGFGTSSAHSDGGEWLVVNGSTGVVRFGSVGPEGRVVDSAPQFGQPVVTAL
jgi:hypothetical protein